MVVANYLWIIGSILLTGLGSMHLYLTFFTRAFSSENEKMIEEMKSSSPRLTKKITMWKAWIGFNGSHGSGVLFIGFINFYLALRHFSILQADHFFFLFTILALVFYAWLARKYWFNIPFTGLLIALICFSLAYVLTLMNK